MKKVPKPEKKYHFITDDVNRTKSNRLKVCCVAFTHLLCYVVEKYHFLPLPIALCLGMGKKNDIFFNFYKYYYILLQMSIFEKMDDSEFRTPDLGTPEMGPPKFRINFNDLRKYLQYYAKYESGEYNTYQLTFYTKEIKDSQLLKLRINATNIVQAVAKFLNYSIIHLCYSIDIISDMILEKSDADPNWSFDRFWNERTSILPPALIEPNKVLPDLFPEAIIVLTRFFYDRDERDTQSEIQISVGSSNLIFI